MKWTRFTFALAFPLFGLLTTVYTGCGGESTDNLSGEDRLYGAPPGYGYGHGR